MFNWNLLKIREGQYNKAFLNICLLVFCLGVLADFKVNVILLASIVAIISVISFIMISKRSNLAWLPVILLIFLSGNLRSMLYLEPTSTDVFHYCGKEAVLWGTLEGDPRIVEGEDGFIHLKYILKVKKIKADKEEKGVTGKVVVYSKEEKSADDTGRETEIDREKYGRSGDSVKVWGNVRELHDYQNPGRINNVMIQRSQGITAQMTADKFSLEINKEDSDWLLRRAGDIRNYYRESMEKVMPKADAAAIFAMLFGGYVNVKEDLISAFTVTGIVHILSVSGSHITLLAGAVGILTRMLNLPAGLSVFLATLAIIFYSILAGAVPPVIRSAVMGILTLVAMTLGQEKDAKYILTLVALIMLLNSPLLLYDISFQLSFGATAGLLYIAPVLKNYLQKINFKGHYLPKAIVGSMAISISAQLSVLPLLAWYFNVISFSALLANLIVVPLVEGIIIIGLLGGLVSSMLPIVGKIVFIAASLLLGIVYELVKMIAALPGSQHYIPTIEWKGCLFYYCFLGIVLQPQERLIILRKFLADVAGLYELREKKVILTGATLIIFVNIFLFNVFHQPKMQMCCIDVGQGLAWLCITPHGHAFMIDTGGTLDNTYDIGSKVDVPYLLHYGVTKLDYIFLTHAHADHAGGVAGILKKIPVGAVMIGHEGEDVYRKTFGDSPCVREEKMLVLKAGTYMELDGVKIEILYSPTKEQAVSGGGATGNEFSNLFRVSYGNASFLITGDLVKEQEHVILQQGTDVGATVLSVGHHGSHSSSSEEFLQAVNPKWSVVSCGFANSFGHPHKDVIEKIKRVTRSKVLRTDQQGAIIFSTDGKGINVETFVK